MTVSTPSERNSVSNSAESARGGSLNAMNPISSSASLGPAATAIVRYPAKLSVSSSFSDAGVIGATVAMTAGAARALGRLHRPDDGIYRVLAFR
jgi:hypothetical protein